MGLFDSIANDRQQATELGQFAGYRILAAVWEFRSW